jgi:hypothetical protein
MNTIIDNHPAKLSPMPATHHTRSKKAGVILLMLLLLGLTGFYGIQPVPEHLNVPNHVVAHESGSHEFLFQPGLNTHLLNLVRFFFWQWFNAG